MENHNAILQNKTAALDNQEFSFYTFRSCPPIYSGGRPPVFDNSIFDGFSLIFAGAGDTLNLMRSMYQHGFEDLVIGRSTKFATTNIPPKG
jgi:hypothetical protein